MTQPTSPSVNASPASSRAPTHDSRSSWIATPSMEDVLRSLLQAGLSRRSPVALPAPPPAHLNRILRRPPRTIAVRVRMEDRLDLPLQSPRYHRLGHPIGHARHS